MSRFSRFAVLVLFAIVAFATVPATSDAQRKAVPRPPAKPGHTVVLRGHVFIGGYFYDPFFGPYPWWPPAAYSYAYAPVYDRRADVRVQVTPRDAAVYVDGFYAGIVDDFDGAFQALPLPPGGHGIVLYLEGYRTVHHNVYLSPASTFKLRDTMERLPAGATSEPPPVVPPVPQPPAGSFSTPRTTPRASVPQRAEVSETTQPLAVGFGTLDLRVQPVSADVTIDGQRWLSSDEGHILVQVPAGMHRVEVSKPGYRRFATEIDVRDSEAMPLNVSLMATSP
jgi:hypothetical protein